MTIEDLASANQASKYTLKSERTYANIRQMRNSNLMRGFLVEHNANVTKVATIGGVDFIDATSIANINAAWLFFEKLNKNVVCVICADKGCEANIKRQIYEVGIKLKNIIFTDTDKQNIEENVWIAKHISSNDDCVVFLSFNQDETTRREMAKLFSDTVIAM